MDVHQATISEAVRDSRGNQVMEAILEAKAGTVLQFIRGLRGSLKVTHRFRDILAVGLLTSGVSVESVSRLLGHRSIEITQQHYAPWAHARQDALDLEIEEALQS